MRSARRGFRAARHPMTLCHPLARALNRLGERQGASLFTILLAALHTLLFRYSGQEHLLVGLPFVPTRQPQGADPSADSPHILPLCADLSDEPSFRELVGRVQDALWEAEACPGLPTVEAIEAVRGEDAEDLLPLFPVLFALARHLSPPCYLPGLRPSPSDTWSGATFDVALELREQSDGLSGWLWYNAELFEGATIARMSGHLQTLLEGIVADPDQPLCRLPLLTPAERHQLLVEWNDTRAEYPRDRCIHQLFEAQVGRTLDAIAVRFGPQSLTYAQLNGKANQLAHYLRALGVGPEVMVGLHVER
jgi:non-ribosomal peptide synthetase component F